MKHEICGYTVREEDRELARSCGAEQEAFSRQALGSPTLMTKTLPGIPHEQYRVLVMAAALKLSKDPTTKDFALAKSQVDKMLVARGIGVVIPNAKPPRVTR